LDYLNPPSLLPPAASMRRSEPLIRIQAENTRTLGTQQI